MSDDNEELKSGDASAASSCSALSVRQQGIIRNTLGIQDGKPGYRNHFCTGEGSDDFADCEALVAAGVMERRTRSWTPDFIYSVIAPHDFY
jgi:hypothetical protein